MIVDPCKADGIFQRLLVRERLSGRAPVDVERTDVDHFINQGDTGECYQGGGPISDEHDDNTDTGREQSCPLVIIFETWTPSG